MMMMTMASLFLMVTFQMMKGLLKKRYADLFFHFLFISFKVRLRRIRNVCPLEFLVVPTICDCT